MKKEKNREYEVVMILKANISAEDRDAQEKSIEDLVKKAEGTVDARKTLGLKSIPYEIRKQREGHFLVWTVSLPATNVDSFYKATTLSEYVLKSTLTIKDHRLDNIPALKKRPEGSDSRPSYARDER
jgi:small subunit ribosomal protein S6